jgi:hypothetical protein
MNTEIAVTTNEVVDTQATKVKKLYGIELIPNQIGAERRTIATNLPILDAMKAMVALSNDPFWDINRLYPNVLAKVAESYEKGETVFSNFTVSCAGGFLSTVEMEG